MKRQFTKVIAISIFALLFSGGLFAQHQHEMSVYGGGGLSTLSYKPAAGDQKQGFGGHFGLGYHFFFSPKWGIGTGAELALYNARLNNNNFKFSNNAMDMNGDPFEFRITVNDYSEKQRAMMLQIPLMLQFQTDKPGSKLQFFAAAGGKAAIPLNGKYSNTADLSNAGYYPYEDALYDTQTFMGFGNFAGRKANGNLDFKTAFLASAEAGVKWKLNNSWSLYTGVYVDYGLNKIVKTDNYPSLPSFVEYNSVKPTEFAVNSIVKSQYTRGGNPSQAFTDKIIPIAAGIKLRLSFGKGSGQTKTQPEEPANYPLAETPSAEEKIPETENKQNTENKDDNVSKKDDENVNPEINETSKDNDNTSNAGNETSNAAHLSMPASESELIETPIDGYSLNQTNLAAYQKQKLDEKIALLQAYPLVKFHIYGHTCDIGNVKINQRIGLERANKAKAYMISKGIDRKRILSTNSKRDNEPVKANTDEDNRKRNRRVVIVVSD